MLQALHVLIWNLIYLAEETHYSMQVAMDIEIAPKAMHHAAYTFGVSYVTSGLQFLFWLSYQSRKLSKYLGMRLAEIADLACKSMQCKIQGEYELVMKQLLCFILYFTTVFIRIYDLWQFQLIWILILVNFLFIKKNLYYLFFPDAPLMFFTQVLHEFLMIYI